MDKITIFTDCDDTILHASRQVINILNQRYGMNKTTADMKDWGYQSIKKGIKLEEISEIYASDDFWNNVVYKKKFIDWFNINKDKFNWHIVTKGSLGNLSKKLKFLQNTWGCPFEFTGIEIQYTSEGIVVIPPGGKASVDMSDGIQIDDNSKEMIQTNAAVRILLENELCHYWNRPIEGVDNWYQCNTWYDIGDVLDFFYKNEDLVCPCYYEDEILGRIKKEIEEGYNY